MSRQLSQVQHIKDEFSQTIETCTNEIENTAYLITTLKCDKKLHNKNGTC